MSFVELHVSFFFLFVVLLVGICLLWPYMLGLLYISLYDRLVISLLTNFFCLIIKHAKFGLP